MARVKVTMFAGESIIVPAFEVKPLDTMTTAECAALIRVCVKLCKLTPDKRERAWRGKGREAHGDCRNRLAEAGFDVVLERMEC